MISGNTSRVSGRYMLDRSDIERAIRNSKSNNGAARYLGISNKTYKKIASAHKTADGKTLYEIHCNKAAQGIPKYANRKSRGHDLIDILEGEVSNRFISMKEIKRRLIVEGYILEECSCCKYKEKRSLDEKTPLIVNYIDGNKRNWKLENIELLCYNCYFVHIGDVFEQKQIDAMEDYMSLQTKKIDFELPKVHENSIKQSINLENKYINSFDDKPEDYGNDLIIRYNKIYNGQLDN